MTEPIVLKAGGYRYLPAVFQYSAGVASEPGFVLEQARFLKPMPLSDAYRERIAAFGDTSATGLRIKLDVVLREMSQRLKSLGFDWDDVTAAQPYSMQDMGALVGEVLAKNGRIPGGIIWHFARPPVTGLEVEMDLRGAVRQIFIS